MIFRARASGVSVILQFGAAFGGLQRESEAAFQYRLLSDRPEMIGSPPPKAALTDAGPRRLRKGFGDSRFNEPE